jgi:hypothetical protein
VSNKILFLIALGFILLGFLLGGIGAHYDEHRFAVGNMVTSDNVDNTLAICVGLSWGICIDILIYVIYRACRRRDNDNSKDT